MKATIITCDDTQPNNFKLALKIRITKPADMIKYINFNQPHAFTITISEDLQSASCDLLALTNRLTVALQKAIDDDVRIHAYFTFEDLTTDANCILNLTCSDANTYVYTKTFRKLKDLLNITELEHTMQCYDSIMLKLFMKA